MQIMAVGWAFQSIASPLGPTMNLLERQDLHLLWDIVRLLGVVAAIVTPAYFGMAVEWSIGFLASNAVLLYGVLILLLPRLIVSQQEEAVHGAAS
jgi:O-antigen/teichoic acid export membrane protein